MVRWIYDGKLIPPNDFIPIFEKNGFIEKLDYYVISEVGSFLNEHSDKKLPVISVNLSGITIMKYNFVDKIFNVISQNETSPSMLDLEITESAIVDDFDTAIEKISLLRELGFTVAMDDFGVGISSLSRLKNIPIDTLKIDRLFIIDALKSKKGATIATAIVKMAKSLEIETVAEGIETIEQKEFFQNLGCDFAQGYYYSRPLPEQEFLQLLE